MSTRYRLAFNHPQFGTVAIGGPVELEDFDRMNGSCVPCLMPLDAELPAEPPTIGRNGYPHNGEAPHAEAPRPEPIAYPKSPRTAILTVPVPPGWVPRGKRDLPPLAVANLNWRLAQSIAARWNAQQLKGSRSPRQWFSPIAYRKNRRWGVVAIDVAGFWKPANEQVWPPEAIEQTDELGAIAAVRARNETEMQMGTIRTWAMLISSIRGGRSVVVEWADTLAPDDPATAGVA